MSFDEFFPVEEKTKKTRPRKKGGGVTISYQLPHLRRERPLLLQFHRVARVVRVEDNRVSDGFLDRSLERRIRSRFERGRR